MIRRLRRRSRITFEVKLTQGQDGNVIVETDKPLTPAHERIVRESLARAAAMRAAHRTEEADDDG